RWRRPVATAPQLSNRFLVDREWSLLRYILAAHGLLPEQGRVAHPLAELHVVGGRAVLVDVHALELAFLVEAQVPRALDGLDGIHDDQGDAEHADHGCGAPDQL